MTNTKCLTLAALMAGAMALPIAGAHAEGYGVKAKTSSNANVAFAKADTDKSGTLSASEYAKMSGQTQSFNTLDTNGDAVLTMSELQPVKSPTTGAGSSTATSANQGTGSTNDAGTSASGESMDNNSGSGMNGRQ